jgi:hypothetical protein
MTIRNKDGKEIFEIDDFTVCVIVIAFVVAFMSLSLHC